MLETLSNHRELKTKGTRRIVAIREPIDRAQWEGRRESVSMTPPRRPSVQLSGDLEPYRTELLMGEFDELSVVEASGAEIRLQPYPEDHFPSFRSEDGVH